MDSQEIVALLQNRDERGAEELLKHYGFLMRYIIAPILPNPQDRDECLSEAVMRVWNKVDLYDSQQGTWNAWLTALTRNMALNFTRKSRWAGSTGEIPLDLPSSDPTPEEAVVQRERSEAVTRALRRLTTKERMLFYRKYYYLQSIAQIASELGMTERAVEGQLYRLKKKLRKMLGGEGHEQP